MKPKNYEQVIGQRFDSFCKKVLKNEARDHYDEIKRLREKEAALLELAETTFALTVSEDKYFYTEDVFDVMGDEIIVRDEKIGCALIQLSERRRNILLLYHFIGHSDEKIAKKLGLKRSAVQYQRTTAEKELRKIMEGAADE